MAEEAHKDWYALVGRELRSAAQSQRDREAYTGMRSAMPQQCPSGCGHPTERRGLCWRCLEVVAILVYEAGEKHGTAFCPVPVQVEDVFKLKRDVAKMLGVEIPGVKP